jgi:glycine cleavage system aminomethyltransferase T
MSVHYGCLWHVCKDVPAPAQWCCQHCDNLFSFSDNNTRVFRTHRKAVWQAAYKRALLNEHGRVSTVVPSAHLGCKLARARLKRHVQIGNGVRVGVREWSRKPRAVQTWKTNPWAVLLRGVAGCL